jgi:hypothetical protein
MRQASYAAAPRVTIRICDPRFGLSQIRRMTTTASPKRWTNGQNGHSSVGENFLYDFKGGQLRSPPHASRTAQETSSTRTTKKAGQSGVSSSSTPIVPVANTASLSGRDLQSGRTPLGLRRQVGPQL